MKTSGTTTLEESAGYLCQTYFGNNTQGSYTINNCINNGNINILSTAETGCGGIIGGFAFYDSSANIVVTVTNCENRGTINSITGGGIFGWYAFRISQCLIIVSDCVNTGPIGLAAGGIFGGYSIGYYYPDKSSVKNCTNQGEIRGESSGGIFGYGGLSNSASVSTSAIFYIENCVNNGAITSTKCGGIMAEAKATTVSIENIIFRDCVNHGDVSTDSGGIAYSVSCVTVSFQNCYSDGKNSGGGILNNQYVPNQINIHNCYTLEGNLYNASNTIIVTNCYIANGAWNSESAMTNQLDYTTDKVWVYDKDDNNITNTSKPFLLESFFPTYDVVGVPLSPELSIQPISDKQVGDADFELVPLFYNKTFRDPNAKITFDGYNSIITITNKTVHINSAGTTTITGYLEGNLFYNEAVSNTVPLTIKSVTDIVFDPIPTKTYGDIPFQLVASSNNTDIPTPAITYSCDPLSSVASVTSTGVVTINGVGEVLITAHQEASDNFTSADEISTLTVLNANTITFKDITATVGQSPITLTASSTNINGPIITYQTSNPAVGSVDGSTLTIGIKGTATITATQQADLNYADAKKSITLTVLDASTLTLSDIIATVGTNYPVSPTGGNGTSIYYAIDDTDIATVSPTNSSNGTIITPLAQGTTTITLTQGDTSTMEGKIMMVNLKVLSKNTLTLLSPPSSVYIGSTTPLSTTTPSDAAIEYTSIPGYVSFMSPTLTGVTMLANKAGTTNISVNQPENDNYGPGEDSFSLTVLLKNPNLVFDSPKTSAFIGQTFQVNASSDNQNTIYYSSSNTTIATVMGKTVTAIGVGTTSIIASQAETETYDEAETSYVLTTSNGNLLYDITSGDAIVIGADYPIQNVIIPSTTNIGGNEYTVVGIADGAFFNKPETLSGTIEFPTTLTSIGASAFRDCALTGYLSLPHSVDSIGASAFRGCGFSGMLVLPPNLTILEEYVFAECSFTSMSPPTQLTSIGARAFYNLPLFVYDFTQCEQLAYIDPTAFDEYNQNFLDINVYVTQFTYDRLRFAEFPTYVKFHTGVPVSNICFIAGTKVQTDQGIFPIESLTRKHTLRGQSITLTKTKHDDPYMVKIQAYAFTDAPTQDTYMSMNHRVYFNHDRVKARDLVNGNTVSLVDYHGEPLYNVLVKAHTSMLVHGMRVETLDPTSPIALVYTSRLPPLQRVKIIQKLNTQENYEETVMYLKRMQ
jgi:hypothetical protein